MPTSSKPTWWSRPVKPFEYIGIAVVAALIVAVIVAIPSLIFWWVWNSEIVVFWPQLPELGWWQTFKLLLAAGVVGRALFKSSLSSSKSD